MTARDVVPLAANAALTTLLWVCRGCADEVSGTIACRIRLRDELLALRGAVANTCSVRPWSLRESAGDSNSIMSSDSSADRSGTPVGPLHRWCSRACGTSEEVCARVATYGQRSLDEAERFGDARRQAQHIPSARMLAPAPDRCAPAKSCAEASLSSHPRGENITRQR